ncbi:MAG: hypothetical protein AAFO82_05320 [Bacteroidota bacterium]
MSWGLSGYYTVDDNLFGFRSGQLKTISSKDEQVVMLDYGYQRDKYEEYGLSVNTGFYYGYNISSKFLMYLSTQYSLGLKTGQSFWFLYTISDKDRTYKGDAISQMKWDNIRFLISLNYKL